MRAPSAGNSAATGGEAAARAGRSSATMAARVAGSRRASTIPAAMAPAVGGSARRVTGGGQSVYQRIGEGVHVERGGGRRAHFLGRERRTDREPFEGVQAGGDDGAGTFRAVPVPDAVDAIQRPRGQLGSEVIAQAQFRAA